MAGIMATLMAGGVNSPATLTLSNQLVIDVVTDPANASAKYRLDNDGYVYSITSAGTTQLEQWCNPAANAANYESYATLNVGSDPLTAGTLDTWQNQGTDREWQLDETVPGFVNASLTVGIRPTGGTTPIVQATIGIFAVVNP